MVDINKKYFLMYPNFITNEYRKKMISYKFKVIIHNLISKNHWVKIDLFDFGKGNVQGYSLAENLDFSDLWYLFRHSNIQENIHGSFVSLSSRYSQNFRRELIQVLTDEQVDFSFVKKLKMVFLDVPRNFDSVLDKDISEITSEYNEWKQISRKIIQLLENGSLG